MKYKYVEGNGLDGSHTHEYVRTHDKSKDGQECGCDYCKKIENGSFLTMTENQFIRLKEINGN